MSKQPTTFKQDQIRALRESGLKSSRGSQIAAAARPAIERTTALSAQATVPAGIAPGPREAIKSSGAARTAKVRKSKPIPQPPSPSASTVAPEATKPKAGRARLEDRDKTIEATKPWVAAKMSRRTWYRRQAEKAGK